MATTLVAAHFSGGSVSVVSVGDSRVYCFRDGVLRQVTEDHTYANRMRREGDMSVEDALQAGSLYAEVESMLIASELDDEFEVFFQVEPFVSGGVTAVITDMRLGELIAEHAKQPIAIVHSILTQATADRCSDDNVSAGAVLVR